MKSGGIDGQVLVLGQGIHLEHVVLVGLREDVAELARGLRQRSGGLGQVGYDDVDLPAICSVGSTWSSTGDGSRAQRLVQS